MILIFSIIGMLILGILAYQDFKYRAISWFLLPLLLFAFVFLGLQGNDLSQLGIYFFVNFCFIVFQVALLSIFFSLKNKKLTNIVNEYIGIGDLLFFVVICAAFSPVNFILFYVVCLLVALLFAAAYRLFFKSMDREIPLAGIFSVALIAVLCLSGFYQQFSLYSENLSFALVPFRAGA